ncbi:hypothetical protein C2E23DRAFT_553096 [Lenzites betulinus]|nr:hypothetical protein C2E23DRAFT_553096 [Lenzites betulinus]
MHTGTPHPVIHTASNAVPVNFERTFRSSRAPALPDSPALGRTTSANRQLHCAHGRCTVEVEALHPAFSLHPHPHPHQNIMHRVGRVLTYPNMARGTIREAAACHRLHYGEREHPGWVPRTPPKSPRARRSHIRHPTTHITRHTQPRAPGGSVTIHASRAASCASRGRKPESPLFLRRRRRPPRREPKFSCSSSRSRQVFVARGGP